MSRLGITALLLPACFVAAGLPAARVSVLVVSEAGVDAYAEAVSGVSETLPGGAVRVMDAGSKTFDRDFPPALESGEIRAVIAIGSRALSEVRARHLALPVIAAMVLTREAESGVRHVDLDIPLAAQLSTMRALWPKKARVGIIRDPSRSRYSTEALEACARKEGFTPVAVDCEGPAQLLKSLAALKGKVDFVLCFPDPDLYNPVTIKPLVLASLEYRLPLVGFSSAFVRAGAAAGIYPDFRDMGRQAGLMVQRLQRGEEKGSDETPRKVQVGVNQRVTHLLGVEFQAQAISAEVFR